MARDQLDSCSPSSAYCVPPQAYSVMVPVRSLDPSQFSLTDDGRQAWEGRMCHGPGVDGPAHNDRSQSTDKDPKQPREDLENMAHIIGAGLATHVPPHLRIRLRLGKKDDVGMDEGPSPVFHANAVAVPAQQVVPAAV